MDQNCVSSPVRTTGPTNLCNNEGEIPAKELILQPTLEILDFLGIFILYTVFFSPIMLALAKNWHCKSRIAQCAPLIAFWSIVKVLQVVF